MPLPGDLTTITVTATYRDGEGNPLSGVVTFTPAADLTDSTGRVILRAVAIPAPVVGGVMSPPVLACTDNISLNPTGWTWNITEYVSGGTNLPTRSYSILLPHTLGSTVDLSTLSPTVPQAGVTSYLLAANNLSDLTNAATARTNLGLGSAATQNTSAFAQTANNLSDLASAAAARTNLGLGGAATENVGTGAGTVAAGNDARITGALQTTGGTMSGPIAMGSNKVTGLANGSASSDAAAFGQIPTSAGSIGGLLAANNLSDVASAATAFGNIKQAASTSASGVVQFDGTAADIQPLGASASAGSVGKAADAGHVHANTGLVTSVNGSAGAVTAAYPLAAAAKQASNFTAAANFVYPVDTTSGAVSAPLPTAPADRTIVGFKLVIQGGTNAFTFTTGGSDVINKTGGPTSGTLTLVNQAVLLIYAAAAGIWYVISDDLPMSDLDGRYVLASTMTTLGDTLYGGSAGAATRLAGNTTATKQFYTQTGTGSVSAAPAWGTIASTDLPAATSSAIGAVLATQVVVGAPTGTYATDVATINTAISAAGTYGTLYFPYSATAYNVDGLAPLTGQTWYGNATLKRPTSSTASIITATGISSFTLRGLTIDGNSSSSASSNAAVYLINTTWTLIQNATIQNCPSGNAAIILRGAVRCLVDACQITNVGYGVLIGLNHGDSYSCYGNAIRDCLIDTTINDAIFITENLGSVATTVTGSVFGTTVTGCTVRNFGDSGIEVGSGSVNTTVTGCTFQGISNGSGNNGILFRDAAHATVTGCTVSGLTKAGSTGVYVINLNGSNTDINITGVDITGCGYGIIAIGGMSPSSLGTAQKNITISGGTIDTTTADGIQMTNVNGFTITGTEVYNAGNQGISIGKFNTAGSGSVDGTITGARIMNSSQGTSGDAGIILFQASADIVITGCRIGDNQGTHTQAYGIRIFDSTVTNVKISQCDVTNGGTTANFGNAAGTSGGIEVYGCTGISAQGLATATTQYGANWEPSDHGLVAWSYDAALASISTNHQVSGGVLYLTGLMARQPFNSTKGYFCIATAGVTATAGENFIGLYNTSGTLLASKEIDSNVITAGLQTITWTTATGTQPAGLYWVGFFFNAGTEPFLESAPTPPDNSTQNVGLGTSSYRMCLQAGPFTTALPSPLTVASNSISGSPRVWWVAIG